MQRNLKNKEMVQTPVEGCTHDVTHPQRYAGQTGITLIALVITIIVLLILAGVTISMLFGDDGIISRAQSAANLWNEAAQDEQEGVDALGDLLGAEKEPRLLIDVAEIGDYVSYSKTYTNVGNSTIGSVLEGTGTKWRVFSKDEDTGIIKIIPAGTPMYEDELENIGNLLDTSVATGIANIELTDIQEMCSQSGISIVHTSVIVYSLSDLNNLLFNGTVIRTNITATDPYGRSGKMYFSYYNSGLVLEYYSGSNLDSNTLGIRPLVTLKTGVMTNKGNGSNSIPYNVYMSD